MRQFLATISLITMITLSVSTHAKDKTHPTPKRKNPSLTLASCADHVSVNDIFKAIDIRYLSACITELKNYKTSAAPNKLKHPDYPSEMTRSLRSYISRYGRIITAQFKG